MEIVSPKVIYWNQSKTSINHHIGRCARICYRAEEKNDDKLIENLWNNNHRSMFRHYARYFIVHEKYLANSEELIAFYASPFVFIIKIKNKYCISCNEQFYRENSDNFFFIAEFEKTVDDIFGYAKEYPELYDIIWFTFRCVTQISTSREFNRVSPNNISEQSTRYVYDDGTICKPYWMTDEDCYNYKNNYHDKLPTKAMYYLGSCEYSFRNYVYLVNNCLLDKQDARGILPIDTATVVAYTYPGEEWKRILDMRLRGTTGKPHPNAKELAQLISDKLFEITHTIK